MSMTKAFLAILLVGAAWASVATATKAQQPGGWKLRPICHKGRMIYVAKHAISAHLQHGDTATCRNR